MSACRDISASHQEHPVGDTKEGVTDQLLDLHLVAFRGVVDSQVRLARAALGAYLHPVGVLLYLSPFGLVLIQNLPHALSRGKLLA